MMTIGPDCKECVHYWEMEPLKFRCGKGLVKQLLLRDARDSSGDCGPSGRYFLKNPSLDGKITRRDTEREAKRSHK